MTTTVKSTVKPTIETIKATSIKEVAGAIESIMQVDKVAGSNCTAAWKKAGSPEPGTAYFDVFVSEQVEKKTGGAKGIGLYIVMEKGSENKLKNKYKLVQAPLDADKTPKLDKDGKEVLNDKGEVVMTNLNAPKYKLTYEVVEAELEHTVTEVETDKEREVKVTNKETGEVTTEMKKCIRTEHEGKLLSVGRIAFTSESQKEAKEVMRDLINENQRDYIIRKIKTSQFPVSTFGFYVQSKGSQEGTYTVFGIPAE